MARTIARLVHEHRGPTAVECGAIAGGVAALAIFATRLLGDDLAPVLYRISLGL